MARWPEAVAALGGLAWFFALAGWRPVLPTNLDWLGYGDRAAQLSAWLLFRNEPWALPLGNLTGLHAPVGTTISIADAIPILAIAARIASPLLPVDFQYFGAWIAACFALQGWYGARLTARWSRRPLQRVAGGLLFALAPPLMVRATDARMLHPSLCGQWLILRGMSLALAECPDRGAARALLLETAAGVALAAFVHPVLAAVTLAVGMGLVARLALLRHLSPGAAATWALGLVALLASAFALLGYFAGPPMGGLGFGHWSADGLFLVNPFTWSRFLPTLPAGDGQYEGFGYPGLGWLVLGAIALATVAATRPRVRFSTVAAWGPLVALALLFGVFALSSEITLAGQPLLRLDRIYAAVKPLTAAFRSSGRFVWLLVYVVCAAALASSVALWSGRPRLTTAALLGAVILQVADLWSPRTREAFEEERWASLDPAWASARAQYRHLVLAPPEIPATGRACYGAYDWDYYVPLAYVAYRLHTTFNSGFVARVDAPRLIVYCETLMSRVLAGDLADDTLYVVHPALRSTLVARGATCGCIGQYTVCVGRARATGLLDTLARSSPRSCAR